MSFPDPAQQPPLPPFLPLPFAGGDVDRFWPTPPMNGAVSQFEHPPPFKRPMSLENNPSSFAPFAQMKSHDDISKSSETKGTGHIFYKTRICAKFSEGTCKNGEHCTYAHGVEDLRNPPPNWQELVRGKKRGTENFSDDQRMTHRTKICYLFYNGLECRYGKKCKFLHERPMKFLTDISKQKRESVVVSIGTTRPDLINKSDYAQPDYGKNVSNSSDNFQAKTAFRKMKLGCKWEIGQCPSGETCHFAHDKSGIFSLSYSNLKLSFWV
ncbi:zinc finger CCCH domain-containing protein 39-like [Olea europaea var. sylvestris]|uniref:zinc finger CCCH domain-containing protein 39-like n=1 Tax=Olea europaea var. sylvestris TaxID=158386 RepID=UPI000C1CE165|nr:zinc finger CCCH domain-containing protein 39-like [Olea europaea var. sylvestris]